MEVLSPFKTTEAETSVVGFDNKNRLARIGYRLVPYWKIFCKALLNGVSPVDLLRSQFAFLFPLPKHPPMLSVEFGTICNLRCVYCDIREQNRPSGFMAHDVFERVVKTIETVKTGRIRIGGGEPTLHPDFREYTNRLAKCSQFLSIVSNGQWDDDSIPLTMLSAPIDLIEISVDAGGKKTYEQSRLGASYDRLLANLETLMRMKKELKSTSLINIRLMVRPSNMAHVREEELFYSRFADIVMKQYLLARPQMKYRQDLFVTTTCVNGDSFRCELLIKNCEIKYNGDIPLCSILAKMPDPGKLILGNILEKPLNEIWNCEIARQYRLAHKNRKDHLKPKCNGCNGICSR